LHKEDKEPTQKIKITKDWKSHTAPEWTKLQVCQACDANGKRQIMHTSV
jgi:hypothetical protein